MSFPTAADAATTHRAKSAVKNELRHEGYVNGLSHRVSVKCTKLTNRRFKCRWAAHSLLGSSSQVPPIPDFHCTCTDSPDGQIPDSGPPIGPGIQGLSEALEDDELSARGTARVTFYGRTPDVTLRFSD